MTSQLLLTLKQQLEAAQATLATLLQQDGMAGVCDAQPAPTAAPVHNYTAPGAWQYAKLLPEYRELIAVIGTNKIRTDGDWLPWGRLIQKYGWKWVRQAAESLDATQRWVDKIESVIAQARKAKGGEY